MYPILFNIDLFEIRSYGLMLMIAFLVGIYLFIKEGKKADIAKERIFDLSFYIIILSILSSRITFILLNLSEYLKDPISILWPITGFSFHGGLIGGILTGVWYGKKYKISIGKLADSIAPSIFCGTSIARIGCFLNGCCYGYKSDFYLAVKFPHLDYFVHPTQIYDSILNLFLFIFLIIYKKSKRFQGEVFYIFLIGASISRFFVEFFRIDATAKLFLFSLTQAQVFCIIVFILSLILIIKRKEI